MSKICGKIQAIKAMLRLMETPHIHFGINHTRIHVCDLRRRIKKAGYNWNEIAEKARELIIK
jgi:hypothetical protein